MTVADVRKRYLDFFAKRGHVVIPSAPVVPENDPTTLFTSSGMQPLVPYLLGQPHPEGNRLVDSQMSFRAEVIEEANLTPNLLISVIRSILSNPEKKKTMEEKAKKFATPDASRLIAQALINLIPR